MGFIDTAANALADQKNGGHNQKSANTGKYFILRTPCQLNYQLLLKIFHQLKNADRRNHALQSELDSHTHIIMLLRTNDIPGLRRLMAAALHRGISAHGLVSHLEQAIEGVYSPHGRYNQKDYHLAFLEQAIAGPRLLYSLNNSHGFASTMTVQ